MTPWVQAGHSFPGLAVGNFDGNINGILQVACGERDASNNLYLYYDTINPKTLAITPGGRAPIGFNTGQRVPLSGFSMAAGRFLGNPANSQLVITYMSLTGDLMTGQTEAVLVDLVNQAPTVKYNVSIPPAVPFAGVGDSFVKAGSLDASSTDQAVIMANIASAGGSISTASIVDFSATPPAPPSVVQTQVPGCGDLAVGRFDPPALASGQPNLDLQVALVSPGSPPTITIYNTVGADGQFAWQQQSSISLSNITLNNLAAVAADYQGRSLVVGQPTITTISQHDQPEIVLGMPPIHVDFAIPNNASTDCVPSTFTTQFSGSAQGQCIVNLSFIPDAPPSKYAPFNTALNFSSTTSSSKTQQSTTSYSFSIATTAEQKISYGLPDEGSISADFTEGLKNAWMTNTQKTFNTYMATSESVASTTGDTDSLFYITYDMNILNYPVIGIRLSQGDAKLPAEPAAAALHRAVAAGQSATVKRRGGVPAAMVSTASRSRKRVFLSVRSARTAGGQPRAGQPDHARIVVSNGLGSQHLCEHLVGE
jgi:hypothetical protein